MADSLSSGWPARGLARFAFAHQQPGHFPPCRQAVFQHKVKWTVAGEGRRLAWGMHPSPGSILDADICRQGVLNVGDQRGPLLLRRRKTRRLAQAVALEDLW